MLGARDAGRRTDYPAFRAAGREKEKLQKAMEAINKKFGNGMIHLAAARAGKWEMKRVNQLTAYMAKYDVKRRKPTNSENRKPLYLSAYSINKGV